MPSELFKSEVGDACANPALQACILDLCSDMSAALADARLQPLAGGLSGNGVFRFELDDHIYVLRRMAVTASNADSIARECEATRLAGDVGVAPKVHYIDASRGVIVTDFVDGKSPSPGYFDDVAHQRELITMMQRYHACASPALVAAPPRDYVRRITLRLEDYRALLSESLHRELEAELADLVARIDSDNDPIGFGHYDLHFNNMMVTAERLVILDWGDACMGSILQDMAQFSIFCHCDQEQALTWLRAYFGADCNAAIERNFLVYRAMSYLLQFSAALENAAKLGGDAIEPAHESKTEQADSHFERARRHFAGEQSIESVEDFQQYGQLCLQAFLASARLGVDAGPGYRR